MWPGRADRGGVTGVIVEGFARGSRSFKLGSSGSAVTRSGSAALGRAAFRVMAAERVCRSGAFCPRLLGWASESLP